MNKSQLKEILRSYFPFGFHLSGKSWDWLDISMLLDDVDTGEPASEIYAIRQLADRLNEKRYHSSYAVEPVQAGQLISVGVIVDILRYLTDIYCHTEIPGIIPNGLDWVGKQKGPAAKEQPPRSFVNLFPPKAVKQGGKTESEYLQDSSKPPSGKDRISSEIVLLSLSMENQAFKPLKDLFDDSDLKKQSPVVPFVDGLEDFFNNQPAFKLLGTKFFDSLRAPMRAAPDSLDGQLDYIKEHWAKFLPPELLERLLLATDILKEEMKLRGLGAGPSHVLQFTRDAYLSDLDYPEPEGFSRDADWMSNVVIIAKSVYVWLDQLSKRYQRHIRYLNDIPDEELIRLARWGFTGLWLIGIWERSLASQKIKQMMGNPEAAASAYSLYDYVVAEDLGGETAYQDLRSRAWRYGIRLASDMVPNHMGIYSKWVVEHPDWFIQSDYTPFPCYQFTGEDLSSDPRIATVIENGYWEHRDAAVVFKRADKWTGDVKYIYHGNDGTSMPWNDTAQLNFLLPEVREAVIQMILHVARKFPIIRFDAAMTLAKRHFQRLWFPKPGDGGAIPSRAEHSLSKAEFDAAFPKEFWREVVDRVAKEAPDTLLLAEAFWLMEGYFVRTLGMHRVYNSAFMNMLKMEENLKYRMTVKNVLEFSPEVLKRFVNFMNNPDEATAVEQFGKGDKYYGVAILMVTMPGLPMFGHGQIEGFSEKYGMEYKKAYWDEQIDEEMVRRHETEIFPLMRRRQLFSGAENFAIYDFNSPEGWVDENVFAYSNRSHNERAVIIFNNAYNSTRGRIHTSTQINIGTDEKNNMVRKTLADALALNTSEGCLYTFRDHKTKLEYIRSGRQIADEGFYAELRGYQYHAFLDFKEIHDTDGSWTKLAHRLNGNGIPNLDEAYREMKLEPILVPFREVINADMLKAVTKDFADTRPQLEMKTSHFLSAVKNYIDAEINSDEVFQDILNELNIFPLKKQIKKAKLDDDLVSDLLSQLDIKNDESLLHIAIAWIAIHHLGRFYSSENAIAPHALVGDRMEEWLLRKNIYYAFQTFCDNETSAYFDALLVKILVSFENLFSPSPKITLAKTLQEMLKDPSVMEYLQINEYKDILWLNREQLDRMIKALMFVAVIRLMAKDNLDNDAAAYMLRSVRQILNAAQRSSYQVEKMINILAK